MMCLDELCDDTIVDHEAVENALVSLGESTVHELLSFLAVMKRRSLLSASLDFLSSQVYGRQGWATGGESPTGLAGCVRGNPTSSATESGVGCSTACQFIYKLETD
jgi:hypothetical protein